MTTIGIYYHISLNFSWNKKCFRQKLYRKSQHNFMFSNVILRNSCRLWDNVKMMVQPDRPQMTM